MAKEKSEYQKQLEQANKALDKLGSYKYADTEGLKAAYNAAYNEYAKMLQNPEEYGYNAYQNDVDSLFGELMKAEQFSYDPKTDSLFQLYRQQYQNQGKRAMNNQLGVASALSGGYNSSAAQSAAQNAYQTYMNALSEKAAQTYQNALDRYKYDEQSRLNKFNTALDMNNASNDAYYKQAQANAQKMNSAYNAFSDDRDFSYNKYSADRSYLQNQSKSALDRVNWLKEYELQKKLYKGG